MSASTVARHYDRLSSEERFRLVLAAAARGDETEQNRLAGSGRYVTFVMEEFTPKLNAFIDVAQTTFLELLEDANVWLHACDKGKRVEIVCSRLSIPPFCLWEELPGFERFGCALSAAERADHCADVPLAAEELADETERHFREAVDWFGGGDQVVGPGDPLGRRGPPEQDEICPEPREGKHRASQDVAPESGEPAPASHAARLCGNGDGCGDPA